MADLHFKRIIIAGSRTICTEEHYARIVDQMNAIIEAFGAPEEIVSGCARGADKLGERYARERGINIKKFPADWDQYGKRAGIMRNCDMANYGDMLVAFWDGDSKGTKHMIDFSLKRGIEVVVVIIKNQ